MQCFADNIKGSNTYRHSLLRIEDIWYTKPFHAICQIDPVAFLDPEVQRDVDLEVLEHINQQRQNELEEGRTTEKEIASLKTRFSFPASLASSWSQAHVFKSVKAFLDPATLSILRRSCGTKALQCLLSSEIC